MVDESSNVGNIHVAVHIHVTNHRRFGIDYTLHIGISTYPACGCSYCTIEITDRACVGQTDIEQLARRIERQRT